MERLLPARDKKQMFRDSRVDGKQMSENSRGMEKNLQDSRGNVAQFDFYVEPRATKSETVRNFFKCKIFGACHAEINMVTMQSREPALVKFGTLDAYMASGTCFHIGQAGQKLGWNWDG